MLAAVPVLPRMTTLARILQVPLRDAADVRRHRRGEQRHLLLGRRLRQDGLHRIGEAHRQHLVGFVQHDGADAVELERAALQVIDDATRRADDHLRSALQRIELRHIALATVDRQHMKAVQSRGVFLERLGDLDGEFARRHQHQRLGRVPLQFDLRQDGQREGRRLAGARLGLAEDVRSLEQRGNGGRLDRARRTRSRWFLTARSTASDRPRSAKGTASADSGGGFIGGSLGAFAPPGGSDRHIVQ